MIKYLLLLALTFLSGCHVITQSHEVVFERPSSEAHYTYPPEPGRLAIKAKEHWEYAVMSENAYHESALFPVGLGQKDRLEKCVDGTPFGLSKSEKTDILERKNPREKLAEFEAKGVNILRQAGWTEWKEPPIFFNDADWCAAVKEGLAFRVYERTAGEDVEIVVSFRGTVFSYPSNWRANFRWFIQKPTGILDANTVVQEGVVAALQKAIIEKYPEKLQKKGALKIYVTGHSLGGSLAQQFAYSFPLRGTLEKYPNLRIAKVYVFDPSPANGWYWEDEDVRKANAGGLEVERIFQHGEALAYIRLILGYVYKPSDGYCRKSIFSFDKAGPQDCTPKISEVRYNLECEPPPERSFMNKVAGFFSTPVDKHSMRLLSCGLAKVADNPPDNFAAGPLKLKKD